MENVTYWLFRSKNVLKRLGFQHLLLIRLISNWTSCHTLQGIIVLVFFQMCVHSILKLLYYSMNCTSLSPVSITNWELFTTIGSKQLSHTTQLWGGGGVEPMLPCLDWRQGISGLTSHLNGRGKGSWRLPTTYIAYFTVRNWMTSCLVSFTYIKSGEGRKGGGGVLIVLISILSGAILETLHG